MDFGIDRTKIDDQSKDILKLIKKRIEINIFSNMSLLEKEEGVDEKMAEALAQEFYPRVNSSEDYRS